MNLVHRALILTLLIYITGYAATHLVPADYEKIQTAITAAQAGDSILVSDGLYRERIDFLGKAVVVCGNLANPERVVIQADGQGSIVVFKTGEGEGSVLCGVTLRGATTDYGGGVLIRETSPVLHNLFIDSNSVTQNGGGIYINGNCRVLISDVTLRNNSAVIGGGLACNGRAEVTVTRMLAVGNNAQSGGAVASLNNALLNMSHFTLDSNFAEDYGGGVYSRSGSQVVLLEGSINNNISDGYGGGLDIRSGPSSLHKLVINRNRSPDYGSALFVSTVEPTTLSALTIVNNFGGEARDAVLYAFSNVTMVNSIIWGNQGAPVVALGDNPPFIVSYTDIQALGDCKGDFLDWSDSIISTDPLFINPFNDDFHLQWQSPCLNSGDPNSPKDADGTRADMGALPAISFGKISGHVLTMEEPPVPIEGALITSSLGFKAITGADGSYTMHNAGAGLFTLRASKEGFVDSIRTGLRLEDDTLIVDFQLSAPLFSASIEKLDSVITVGDSITVPFTIRNSGNGVAVWTLTTTIGDGWKEKEWSWNRSVVMPPVGGKISADGVAFGDDQYLIACRADDGKYIMVLDKNGNEIGWFDQPGEGLEYMTDIAWNGELVLGVRGGVLYGFTIQGEVKKSFNWNLARYAAVAWDSERQLVWLMDNGLNSPLTGYDLDGNLLKTVNKPPLAVTGLAFWEGEPQGYQLFLMYQQQNETQLLNVNLNTGQSRFTTTLNPPQGESPKAGSITNTLAPYGGVAFIAPITTDIGGQVDIWSVKANFGWIDIQPNSERGELHSGDETEFKITLDATDLDTSVYEASLRFDHTALGDPVIIPITLTIVPEVSVTATNRPLPTEFAITALYPNPFNARLNIAYALPQAGDVNVTLFDLNGREVHRQVAGTMTAGYLNLRLDCSHLPTGLYMVQVSNGGRSITQKALLLK